MDVAWSKYDTEIATASMDTSIRIWDAQKGVQLTMLLGHAGYLQKVDWCPVYDRIVSGGYAYGDEKNAEVIIWSMKPWRENEGVDLYSKAITIKMQNKRDVLGLAWSPDGTKLAVSCRDPCAVVYSVSSDSTG